MPKRTRHYWITEFFPDGLITRRMFGCDALYFNGKLCLVLADAAESPWQGILVCTAKEYHSALLKELPELAPHPVLGKWLYIAEGSRFFEEYAESLARLITRKDFRIGVESKKRARGGARAQKKKGSVRANPKSKG